MIENKENVPDPAGNNEDKKSSYNVVWDYEFKRGEWFRYTEEIIKKLNNSDDVVSVVIEDAPIDIDIKGMKQINMVSSFRRNIRCSLVLDSEENIIWEYMRGRQYICFPKDIQQEMERQKADGQETFGIVLNGKKYDVNLLNMEMSNDEGSKRRLRRHECVAGAAISSVPTVPAERTRGMTKRSAKSVDYKAEVKDEVVSDNEDVKPSKSMKLDKSSKSKTNKSVKSRSDFYKSTKRVLVIKGRAPVDPECTEKVDVAHVLDEGNVVWDAMLNQTNIAQNNNKFYILQLLEDDKAKNYSVWFRWGRVGYRGQDNLFVFGSDLEDAKACFCKKFHDKTYNEWSERHDFERVPGKYTLIEMDYNVAGMSKGDGMKKEEKEEDEDEEDTDLPCEESKLDLRIRNFIGLICNTQAMEEAATQMEYDSARAPLGKLTKHQISEGNRLLSEIEEFVSKKKFDSNFINTVNEYYTKIPHNFGFRQPPMIKTIDQIKKENELLEFLEEIEIAIRTLGSGKVKNDRRDPCDRFYENMECDLTPIDNFSDEYKIVEDYLTTNHASTHMYSMNIINVFKVRRSNEEEQFMSDLDNRKLLWHGSRLTNIYGILSQGLRIAPPEAPTCGYMFGKGVYFADMASKSGNYCYPAPGKPGVLLLSEVALGNPRALRDADYEASKLPKGSHSTLGEGSTIPNAAQHVTMDDGLVVPCGKPVKREEDGKFSLLYNEYVVYDTKQVKIKYAVEVEFDL
ncbi:unnamed protein product [Auanema sp. JU1783]|nr:unnamed protein product [Auanema sp. JU1783]